MAVGKPPACPHPETVTPARAFACIRVHERGSHAREMMSPFEVSGRASTAAVRGLGRAFHWWRGGGCFLKDFVFQVQPGSVQLPLLAFDAGAQQCVAQLEQPTAQRLRMQRGRDLPQPGQWDGGRDSTEISDSHSWIYAAVKWCLHVGGSIKEKERCLMSSVLQISAIQSMGSDT